jgi:hypothetical protein
MGMRLLTRAEVALLRQLSLRDERLARFVPRIHVGGLTAEELDSLREVLMDIYVECGSASNGAPNDLGRQLDKIIGVLTPGDTLYDGLI